MPPSEAEVISAWDVPWRATIAVTAEPPWPKPAGRGVDRAADRARLNHREDRDVGSGTAHGASGEPPALSVPGGRGQIADRAPEPGPPR